MQFLLIHCHLLGQTEYYKYLNTVKYNNTTLGIAFLLLCCNVDTLITDFVYALFDLMQPMFVNGTCLGKSWKRIFRVLENPGIWSLLVLESPGKRHFNVCTNPVLVHVTVAACHCLVQKCCAIEESSVILCDGELRNNRGTVC